MHYWSVTDPGCVRTQNQDAHRIERLDRNTTLFVVCDGMGGAKAGNIASTLAADVFAQEIKNTYKSNMDTAQVDQMLRGAVKLANFTVFDQSQQFEEFQGMGTTLVAVLLRARRMTVVNVGDSRVYCVNEGGIRRMTTDHSLVQMMVDRGELTAEQARKYPGKNYITRAIGTENMVRCDLDHMDLERGDCLLVCSDGLSNMMDDQEILFEIIHGGDHEGCCQRLLEIAKNRGAPDNVTCILAEL